MRGSNLKSVGYEDIKGWGLNNLIINSVYMTIFKNYFNRIKLKEQLICNVNNNYLLSV